ncbi:MAG: hypothetical protein AB7L13_18370 [Acidimicrobiia bacterium]
MRDVAYVNSLFLAATYLTAAAVKARRDHSWVAALEIAVAGALIAAPPVGAVAALVITGTFVATSSSWSFGQGKITPTGAVAVTRTWLLLLAAAVAFGARSPMVPNVFAVGAVAFCWLIGAVVVAMVRLSAEPATLLAAVPREYLSHTA